jgi:hypothetical protein
VRGCDMRQRNGSTGGSGAVRVAHSLPSH